MLHALRSGARGYLLKGQISNEDLLASIILVGNGGKAIGPAVLASLHQQGAAELLRLIPLGARNPTERRKAILRLLAVRKTREQIADALGFSERTVRREIKQLEQELHAQDLSLLLMQAALYGLLDDGPAGPSRPSD